MTAKQELREDDLPSHDAANLKPIVITTFSLNVKDPDTLPSVKCINKVLQLLKQHAITTGLKTESNWERTLAARETASIDLEPAREFTDFIDQHVPGRESDVELTLEATGPTEGDPCIDFTIIHLSFYEKERVDLQSFSKEFTSQYKGLLAMLEEMFHHEIITSIRCTDDPEHSIDQGDKTNPNVNEMNDREFFDEKEDEETSLEDLPSRMKGLDDGEFQAMVNQGFKNSEYP
ncbi:MAG: hypothetical protein ACFFCS_23165 [Candidatus Hodarchaeota archaeon]